DVDGLNPKNLGKLLLGQTSLAPCTPSGILQMCDYYHIKTSGRHAVVIGRSAIVGKPIASMLMQKDRNATVTICHSKTEHLEEITRQADILVVAMGKAEAVCASMVKPGAVVIDVGINRIPDASKKRGYRIVGDVDFDSVSPICSAITPVPKGVGPMTIAMLMSNTLSACTMQHGVMQ
ncbi:MAG: bifunctional 5,10-methylenetetrahydrofolate dehydrogenase/5,10-methenyltetrahydrofolate cyclohydrolase, partial [Sphaerochaetaceae bacterium]|nr:bifunctional 5,10-methylenetetrahydrofolate dehydrogenase/5,10-methenyltetrahydrofolate cyclohydrolase [Sphaerochaetaceae bacterium]